MLKVRVAEEHAERASELLFESGFGAIAESVVGGHIALTTSSGDAELDAQAERTFLEACASEGLSVQIEHEEPTQDWELSWTRYLEPVQVTHDLRLVPGAPGRSRVPGDIHLEPTLAFGFGEHPTTRLALRWLAHHARGKAVLDFGTGTGVLALGAAHFGAHRVMGLDIDVRSVHAARHNAVLNEREGVCQFSLEPLSALQRDFDVVVANIDAETLKRLAPELCTHVGRGRLALTGVLEEQEWGVVSTYLGCGFRLKRAAIEDDWVLLENEI